MYNVHMYMRTVALAVVSFILGTISIGVAYAWSGPTAAPPGNNVAAPINVGSTDQVKNGGLGVNTLTVFGNSLFGGFDDSDAYLNFGDTSGSAGYGIRDNNGLLEFKNSSSTWQSLQSVLWTLCGGPCGGGTSPWTTSGNNIYNSNTANVGIGQSNPTAKLYVTNATAGQWGLYVTSPTYGAYVQGNGAAYLGYSGYGLYTGNNVYASNYYIAAIGLWASQLRNSQQLGPVYTVAGCNCGNNLMTACMYPAYFYATGYCRAVYY